MLNNLCHRFGKVSLPTPSQILVFALCILDAGSARAQGDLVTREEPLYILSTSLWTTMPIPVCWESPTAANRRGRAWVQDAVRSTWEAVSAVRFSGWGTCPAAAGNGNIRIRIRDRAGESPHVKVLGNQLAGRAEGMVLNFTFRNWSPDCGALDHNLEVCTKSVAVHEFGHALGFAHEQARPDRPDDCKRLQPGGETPGDTTVGNWDLMSVMNYCNPRWNNNGQPSPTDVAGVRGAYGFNSFLKFPAFTDHNNRNPRTFTGYKRLTGDFNNDGLLDFLWNITTNHNRLYVALRRRNDFTFLAHRDLPKGGWSRYRTLVADIDGQNGDDVVWNILTDHNRVYTVRSNGDGTFSNHSMQTLPHSGWSGYEVLTGDVNGNGRDDLIWSKRGKGNRAYVGLSRGDGTFVFRGPIDFPHSGWSNYTAMTGDVDDDGRTDLIFNSRTPINRTYVALSRFPLSLEAAPNNALPSFDLQTKVDHPQSSREAFGGYTVHSGDFNADGCTDLLWNITKEPNRTYISFSRGDGTFVHKPAEDHPRETWGSVLRVGGSTIFDLFRKRSKPSNIWGGYRLVVTDVNGDRRDDLLWNRLAAGNRIYLATSRGDGSLDYIGFQDHPNTGWSKFSVHPGGAIQGATGLMWNSADPVNRLYVANPLVRAIAPRNTPGCNPP